MAKEISPAQYRALADLRHRIRHFLREGDDAAQAGGLEPQQYQLLLALRGLEDGELATVGALADRLIIKHHSAVELLDRLESRAFIRRVRSSTDRRQVLVELLPRGKKVLAYIVKDRLKELRKSGPALAAAIKSVVRRAERRTSNRKTRGRS